MISRVVETCLHSLAKLPKHCHATFELRTRGYLHPREDGTNHPVYCEECKKDRPHDAPGATEKFRSFFEKYTSDPGLKARRNKKYGLRSKILHGSDLMQLDQGRAFGWDPSWWNEREMNTELWGLVRTAARNWLKERPGQPRLSDSPCKIAVRMSCGLCRLVF